MLTSELQSSAVDAGVDPEVSAILRSLAPEEVDMLRDAFIYMDKDSDGYVSREEMMAQVAACVGPERFDPLQEYLVPLFGVADRDGDGRLSLTEFLAAFADGPGVVPAEVINNCVSGVRVRLTDEEIFALQDNFRRIDANQDGVVDAEELEAALREHLLTKFPDLTGENFKEIVSVVMASADADRNGVLSLSEFIRSYQEDQGVLPATFLEPSFDCVSAARQLTEEETTVLREAFAVLDRNDDGFVDAEDLYNALWDTLGRGVEDKDQIRDLCDLIMMTAARSRHGRLTVTDFIRGFLSNVQLMQIPVAVAQERVRVACDKLQEMHNSGELEKLVLVYEDLDSDGDGYVARSEMVNVLKTLFRDAFPGWDNEMLTSVMTAIVVGAETNNGARISLEEFIRSFVEGPGALSSPAGRSLKVSSWRQANAPDATAASAPHRERNLSTATDEDLQRISEAIRNLHAQSGRDGRVAPAVLHTSIAHVYADDPQHGEEMYQYVLQQFVRPRSDGALEWNERVHIEDEDEAEAGVDVHCASAGLAAAASTPNGKATLNGTAFAEEAMRTQPKTLTYGISGGRAASGGKAMAVPLKPSALDGLHASQDGSRGSSVYFDADLQQQFDRYDIRHKGYLDRETFKKTYRQMEHFGLEPSPKEVDVLFRRYANGSDRIYFNEFCILMLQRARL
ncbi:putative calmodulin-related protein [Leptomonas pyrrhocoris]|uniref:Putative calmodulin-related protein n=1 Tax=Leptomonas pyrrhocoris TaxID=157538 RepID=A0A0N0VGN4_LEPPY|nr:putative calmodulin-related protein [Leptomonas pyrrhocoris]KPA83478.1 putative calmodulin-related protein [Leptomonas pyrrhocoris]|eukprot:XP_015661917.1 putative calmodulin-related protein [Leptomonas pyrrhocoris]